MRTLLIEDEIPAARQLVRLLGEVRPSCQIVETLDSVEGAVKWLRHFPTPDLIFMDIQIADGLSLDIFEKTTVTAPVIFTTAYDHYAVQAFKINAIDYLLKPVDPSELSEALARFDQRQLSRIDLQALSSLFRQEPQFKERFLIKSGQHFVYLETGEVALFYSADGLTQAYTYQGKKHFVDQPLDELERSLNPKEFFRVSRNAIIALKAIRKVHPHLNGRLKIESETAGLPADLFVSRDRAPAFKEWLGA